MDVIKPRRLRRGDRVAAVTLSWGGPGEFPRRYEAGKRQLEDTFGVEVVEMRHTMADPRTVAAGPAARVDDFHDALSDPAIAGIISTIGGDDSIRLLPLFDLDVIRANPKVVLGYSDTTVTQMAMLKAGVTSFYGPAIMAGFGENGGLDEYLVDGVRRTIFEATAPLEWPENRGGWTVEMPDWSDPGNQAVKRQLQPSQGWRWHGGQPGQGVAIAVCLDVAMWLRGTEWWPSLDGAVLFVETSEEAPPPEIVARFVRSLAAAGELQRLAGLVFGRPGGVSLTHDDRVAYDDAVVDVVRREIGITSLPIVTNVDFGHTDPMWTIPQGVPVRIEPATRRIAFLEAGVEP